MKRIWLNMVVNALSLLVFMSMISTGLLLKFVLPPGSGRIEKLFSAGGGHAARTVDTYMGLTRHEWGEIHFWIALVFLILLIVHLMLHWSWIKCIAWGTHDHPQSLLRRLMTLGIIGFVVLSVLLPFMGEKEGLQRADIERAGLTNEGEAE